MRSLGAYVYAYRTVYDKASVCRCPMSEVCTPCTVARLNQSFIRFKGEGLPLVL